MNDTTIRGNYAQIETFLNIPLIIHCPPPPLRNLDVMFYPTLFLEPHIHRVVKTSFYHLRNIAKVRPSLIRSVSEQLIHAFISSCLDYYN